jgi:hypothetical protein
MQVFGIFSDHVVIPGVALIALCVSQVITDGYRVAGRRPKLTPKEKAAAALFAVVLFAGISMPLPLGIRYGFLLVLSLFSITAVLVSGQQAKKRKPATEPSALLTEEGVRTTSILLVYIISFHLGTQIWFSLAFQSIIIISCLLVYLLQKDNVADLPSRASVKSQDWGKYWNAFIGVWCIMIMKDNGFFTEGQEHLIIFAYIILLFLIYLGGQHHFKAQEILWIAFMSAFLTSIDPLTEELVRTEMPSFIQAFLIIVAFDLGGMYFLHRMQTTLAPKNLQRKAFAYLLAGFYIFQVNQMVNDPAFDVETLNMMLKGMSKSVYSSVLNIEPAANIGIIEVTDAENSFHRANP